MCWITFFPTTTKTTLKRSMAFSAPRHHSKLHHCSDVSCRHAIPSPWGGFVLNATQMSLCFDRKGWFSPECLGPSSLKAQSLVVLQPHLGTLCVLGSALCSQQHRKPPQPHSVIGALAAATQSWSQFSLHCPLHR